jgi:hypothetical protein
MFKKFDHVSKGVAPIGPATSHATDSWAIPHDPVLLKVVVICLVVIRSQADVSKTVLMNRPPRVLNGCRSVLELKEFNARVSLPDHSHLTTRIGHSKCFIERLDPRWNLRLHHDLESEHVTVESDRSLDVRNRQRRVMNAENHPELLRGTESLEYRKGYPTSNRQNPGALGPKTRLSP